jgi:peptidoglycan/xylan/chitin deacetylase (PgdA/CDA1 family)
VSAAVTVDVDGPAGLACRPGGPWTGRLTAQSEHEYVWTGLQRVVDVLDRYRARATFYVPGVTIEENPAACRELLAAGHHVAHHGYRHLPTTGLDAAGQRDELERGIEALGLIGAPPTGYRSPGWELTPATLALLPELGFAWDSSLMGGERPYRLERLLELPVHWRLDDVPYFAALRDAREVLAIWTAEHDAADHDVTYTIHPEFTGRGHRILLLEGLLDHVGPTVTHAEMAA